MCVAASSSSLELELQQEELAPEFRRLLVAKAPERATKLATHSEAAINPNQGELSCSQTPHIPSRLQLSFLCDGACDVP